MPQFDPSSFASQLLWLVVFFVLMYQLVVRLVVPALGGVMEQRQRAIDDDLAKAADLKTRTNAAIESYDAALADARARAQALLRETAEEIATESEARNRDVGERLAARIADGEARIEAARAEALDSVRDVAADVAVEVTRKLTGDAAEGTTARASVDAVMRETH